MDSADPTLELTEVLSTRDPDQLAKAKSLLQGAGIPLFLLSGSATRVRVPKDRAAEAREILQGR